MRTCIAVIAGAAQRQPGIHNHHREYGWSIFQLERMMVAHPTASWFETRGGAVLLTMRV
jgi:hypothetical protein